MGFSQWCWLALSTPSCGDDHSFVSAVAKSRGQHFLALLPHLLALTVFLPLLLWCFLSWAGRTVDRDVASGVEPSTVSNSQHSDQLWDRHQCHPLQREASLAKAEDNSLYFFSTAPPLPAAWHTHPFVYYLSILCAGSSNRTGLESYWLIVFMCPQPLLTGRP